MHASRVTGQNWGWLNHGPPKDEHSLTPHTCEHGSEGSWDSATVITLNRRLCPEGNRGTDRQRAGMCCCVGFEDGAGGS